MGDVSAISCTYGERVSTLLTSDGAVRVSRRAFTSGKAECCICGSRHITPVGDSTRLLVRRRFGPNAEAAECGACGLMTYFIVEDD